jgi:hypothetical protein
MLQISIHMCDIFGLFPAQLHNNYRASIQADSKLYRPTSVRYYVQNWKCEFKMEYINILQVWDFV